MNNDTKVLLSGVSGFLGSHTTIQLLEKGYRVIGTVRDEARAEGVKTIVAQHTDNVSNLTIVQADLTDVKIWRELTKGVDYVQHIASPFPRELPEHEDDLIIPAKQGTLNVLQAAASNGVKRVVLTSSSGAIVYGKEKNRRNGMFNETDWTNIDHMDDTTPYFRSKTIAEKTAWDFIEKDNSTLELVTICPGAILGPILEQDFGTSANIVIKMMDGSTPAIPRIGFDIVDVRSVADLHIKAMEMDAAAGQRFIAASGYMSFKDVVEILRQKYPERRLPSFQLPNFALRILALFDKTIRPILVNLGYERKVDNTKAKKLLQWNPISTEEAVIACAESVNKQGLV